jgi:hypothetical protein
LSLKMGQVGQMCPISPRISDDNKWLSFATSRPCSSCLSCLCRFLSSEQKQHQQNWVQRILVCGS